MSPRYLALGDSYTIGEDVPAHARWPMQLADKLRAQGIAIGDPKIVAVTGWTTDELSAGMDQASLVPGHDLVTLLIGVNNQYRGRPAKQYRDEFRALLLRAITLAGHRPANVVVVSIPDWGVTPFGHASGRDLLQIAHELDVFNLIAREEAAHAGARFVNITSISREHPWLVANDGLHPSAAQYALWTEAIEPIVRTALRESREAECASPDA
ncbi:SGNH/GDSL hydrolase family protein [Dyella caseinilytica]|uniref:SGNH/GDSL hydrolase family protein n=1 Tax=Dyella caseinilytica TaxID=1849581 RepID=A0ABX7GVF4_9GAMM|nr:SGNH/GDSL hydrolase family protein [Dyella caseinilytica]QRN53180.1 SGNH/GDSL hydrolase family protein [Dyella caseinilytica]GGA12080.1 lysophospholipase [Dyella caseinilytica]